MWIFMSVLDRVPSPVVDGVVDPIFSARERGPRHGLRVFSLLALALVLAAPSPRLAAASKVAFRDDHVLLCDGKPFFPIGLYYCAEEFEDTTDTWLKELKGYGFNTLGFYRYGEPGWRADLDRAGKLGFKVWVRGVNGLSLDSPEIEKSMRQQIADLRDHPAMLLWEVQDEPILNKVSHENTLKGQKLVRAEDPNHPILMIEWPAAFSRFAEWKDVADVAGTDLYPVPRERKYGAHPNHDVTQIRDYIKALRDARGDRPILMVLQAWAWEPLKDGEHGYPTPVESRFMAYQAVIHGACGIHYYGQFHASKPNSAAGLWSQATEPAKQRAEFERCLALNKKFWERHQAFFRELGQATAIFTLRDAPEKERPTVVALLRDSKSSGDKADAPAIQFRTKKNGDRWYLLAVNADARRVETTFKLADAARASTLHVLFENRVIPVKDGKFTDSFEPYDTHVYANSDQLPR